MIKTTFSDGTVDIYKGKRAVQFGWAIIDRETGKVVNNMTGHSVRRDAAESTARNNMRYCGNPTVNGLGRMEGRPRTLYPGTVKVYCRSFRRQTQAAGWTLDDYVKHGLTRKNKEGQTVLVFNCVTKWVAQHNAEVNAEIDKQFRIEIVEVENK